MLEQPFMDQVHRSSYHGFGMPKPWNDLAAAKVRGMLRHAQRFVIDDKAVRLITELAQKRERLPLWSILARLPYSTFWLEFDLHEKAKINDELGTSRHPFKPNEVSRACGYLIHLDGNSNSRWVAHEFGLFNDGGAYPQPVAFVFDPCGSALQPVRGSVTWGAKTLSLLKGIKPPLAKVVSESGDQPPVGVPILHEYAYVGDFDVKHESECVRRDEPTRDSIITALEALKAAPWAEDKVAAIVSPLWENKSRRLQELLDMDSSERAGAFRWLIVALATINDVPKTIKAVNARPGRMSAKAHSLKYFDHHIISINVPKANQIRWAARELSRKGVAAHRAWHPVRGHWRVAEYGLQLARSCRHEPTEVDGDYALCTHCERLLRWIPDHHRGDPRIGIISHDYEVTA